MASPSAIASRRSDSQDGYRPHCSLASFHRLVMHPVNRPGRPLSMSRCRFHPARRADAVRVRRCLRDPRDRSAGRAGAGTGKGLPDRRRRRSPRHARALGAPRWYSPGRCAGQGLKRLPFVAKRLGEPGFRCKKGQDQKPHGRSSPSTVPADYCRSLPPVQLRSSHRWGRNQACSARRSRAAAASSTRVWMMSAAGSSFFTIPTDWPAITEPLSTSPSITARRRAPAQ